MAPFLLLFEVKVKTAASSIKLLDPDAISSSSAEIHLIDLCEVRYRKRRKEEIDIKHQANLVIHSRKAFLYLSLQFLCILFSISSGKVFILRVSHQGDLMRDLNDAYGEIL
jgi:hypothetical protein